MAEKFEQKINEGYEQKESGIYAPKTEQGHIRSSEEVDRAKELIPEDKKIESAKKQDKEREKNNQDFYQGGTLIRERLEKLDREQAAEKREQPEKKVEKTEKKETTEKGFEERLDLLFGENKKDLSQEEKAHLSEIHKKAESVGAPWVFGLLKEMGMRGQKNEILGFKPENIDTLREFIKNHSEIKPEEGLTKKEFEALRLCLENSKEKEQEIIEKIKSEGMAEGITAKSLFEQKAREIQEISQETTIFGNERRTQAEARSEEVRLYLMELRKLGCYYFLKHEGGIKGALKGFFTGKEKVTVVDKDGNPIKKEGRPVEFKANWAWHHPEKGLVDFLKKELKEKLQAREKGEVLPEEEMLMRQELEKKEEKEKS